MFRLEYTSPDRSGDAWTPRGAGPRRREADRRQAVFWRSALRFAEDIPTMVSKRASETNCGDAELQKTNCVATSCLYVLQHNAGPTGLGPREAAARVWSIASGGNDSLRRRRATVSSLPAADTHLHANAPRRAPRKNSAFSPADTRRRASPPATHRIDSCSPADTRIASIPSPPPRRAHVPRP